MLLAAVSVSCIREDLSDCPTVETLRLSYLGDGTTEIFTDKINRVELFVFDEDNRHVASRVLSDEEIASRTAQLPPLMAGDYRIICLGNTHNTSIDGLGTGSLVQMRFTADDYLAKEPTSGNDSLYYASKMHTVRPYTDHATGDMQTIEFACSHYDLSVEIAGIALTSRAGEQPVIEVSGVKPYTDFENRACGEDATYRLETEYDADSRMLTALTNIMRHEDHSNVYIRLLSHSGGDTLAEVNLGEFLADNPIIDCTKQEVLIPIRIEFLSGNISVSVPEWYVEIVRPEF